MKDTSRIAWAVLLAFLLSFPVSAQRMVRYDLVISDTTVTYTGKTRPAMAINGTIPGPVLRFTEGDTARIVVHNRMHHATSIHWHGLLLPNEQDGVPNLTTAPIAPMSDHVYEFPIRQSGTYWYHSHTMLQEQLGVYGAFIIQPRVTGPMPEEVLLLSDWSDEPPARIERRLHRASDWYMIRKRSVQSYAEAIGAGRLGTKLENEWKRMHAMDVSDVYYDRFLVNGHEIQRRPRFKAGDQVRLRIINGSSSTYFWMQFAGGPLRVVASDGMPVEPVEVDRLIVGVSETYDVVVTIPANMSYEMLAMAEDRTGGASFWLGDGHAMPAPVPGRLKYFEGMKMMNGMMTLGGRMTDMGMQMSLQAMDMNEVMYPELDASGTLNDGMKMDVMDLGTSHDHPMTDPEAKDIRTLNYTMLRSPVATTLPDGPWQTLHFDLTGNMNRYVWSINNRTVSETDKIRIRAGYNIRIVITNNTMMRHPLHLHGHFFRVVNGHGTHAPLKNVLDILPMETDTIEFHASEGYGDWFFHCHILYHMMAGMGRIFTYEDSPPNPQLPDPDKALRRVYAEDRRFFPFVDAAIKNNGTEGVAGVANTRWNLNMTWRAGWNASRGYEWEGHLGRYFGRNQFLLMYAGWDWRYREGSTPEENLFGQASTVDRRGIACLGLVYTLPWMIDADLRVDHTGYVRLQFERHDIPVTPRLRLSGMFNTDLEYAFEGSYILNGAWALTGGYDSHLGWGGGIRWRF